jgi:hypothetical protein
MNIQMSSILYYSNYCEFSKKILEVITKSNIKNKMHFICIDKRIKKQNNIYIILNNGQEVLLPPKIDCVPSLLLLNKNHHIIQGNNILNHLQSRIELEDNHMNKNNNNNPSSFSIYNFSNNFGVTSDEYSYLDQNSDELSAKGNGGLRQIHHYSSIHTMDNIETPPDTYSANTIGEVNMESLVKKRNNEIN